MHQIYKNLFSLTWKIVGSYSREFTVFVVPFFLGGGGGGPFKMFHFYMRLSLELPRDAEGIRTCKFSLLYYTIFIIVK